MKKENIRLNLEKLIFRRFLEENQISFMQDKSAVDTFLKFQDFFVDQLMDLSITSTLLLSREQLVTLRLRVGVFHDGNFVDVKNIAQVLGISNELVLNRLGVVIKKVRKYTKAVVFNADSLECLLLARRTYSALARNGIFSISEIISKNNNFEEFSHLKGFGIACFNDLVNRLHECGYYFKDELVLSDFEKIYRKNM